MPQPLANKLLTVQRMKNRILKSTYCNQQRTDQFNKQSLLRVQESTASDIQPIDNNQSATRSMTATLMEDIVISTIPLQPPPRSQIIGQSPAQKKRRKQTHAPVPTSATAAHRWSKVREKRRTSEKERIANSPVKASIDPPQLI